MFPGRKLSTYLSKIWVGILYFSLFAIVLQCYKYFIPGVVIQNLEGNSIKFDRDNTLVLTSNSTTVTLTTTTTTTSTSKPPPTPPSYGDPAAEILQNEFLENQVLYKQDGLRLYLYSAYLDDRYDKAVIRIFGLEHKDEPDMQYECVWRETSGVDAGKETISNAQKVYVDKSWPPWSLYYAKTFDCYFPFGSDIQKVTLKTKDGVFSYVLPVKRTIKLDQRKDMAVCVKPITGQFSAIRMAEWFEHFLAVGVKNFIIYDTDFSGTGTFVMEYYKKRGNVTKVLFPFLSAILGIVDYGLTSDVRYAVYQQTYLIAINDCLYRFMGSYEYIVNIDLDEIILPTHDETLVSMIERAAGGNTKVAGFLLKTAWHFEDFERENQTDKVETPLYLQRYIRATKPTDNQPKSIIVTQRVLSVNFHTIIDVPYTDFLNIVIDEAKFGYIHHYRGQCSIKFIEKDCQTLFQLEQTDPVITRYKITVEKKVFALLDLLQLT